MIDGTNHQPWTPLDQLAGAVEILPWLEGDPTFPELAFTLSVEGVYDHLDDHDRRHAAAVTLLDVISGGLDALRGRAEWIASGGGAAPLHDSAAVATALLWTADLLERMEAGR